MSVESIESSEQDNRPRELIYIVHGATSYRLTSGVRDVVYNSALYKAAAVSRGEIAVLSVDDDNAEMSLTLPIDHPYVRRYFQLLVPPQKTSVTVRRLYSDDSIETIWSGEITSVSVDDGGTEATFRVPARANDAALRMLPTISVSRACPYILYGPGCTVSRDASVLGLAHKVTTTVLYVNGRDVRVDLADTDRNGDWAEGGELAVTGGAATSERMTIREQNDLNPGISSVTTLSLQLPIPGLKVGDPVNVFAGCKHDIETCRVKFGNHPNYGGYPSLPIVNPFKWER